MNGCGLVGMALLVGGMGLDERTIDSRAALENRLETIAGDLDGRLGAFVGIPRDIDEFDAVYRRRARETFPSASVIKVLVGYALYREYDDALEVLDRPHGIAPENRVGGSGVARLFDADLSLADLHAAMVAVSDNAATNELIDHLGTAAINEAAADLGLEATTLGRKMMETIDEAGLEGNEASGGAADSDGDAAPETGTGSSPDHSTDPTNAISPRDGADLLAELLYGDRLTERAYGAQLEALRAQNGVWLFHRYVPESWTLAHKSGCLPDATLEVGVVFRGPVNRGAGSGDDGGSPPGDRSRGPGSPLVFAVCCDHLESRGDGADAIAAVGDATRRWIDGR
jgi:beta-lactamase class A